MAIWRDLVDQMAPPRATPACGASWHAARPARTWGPSVIVTAQGTKATLATAMTDGPALVTGKYHRTRLFVLTLGYKPQEYAPAHLRLQRPQVGRTHEEAAVGSLPCCRHADGFRGIARANSGCIWKIRELLRPHGTPSAIAPKAGALPGCATPRITGRTYQADLTAVPGSRRRVSSPWAAEC